MEDMRHVRGSACFETCETEFRYSKCIRQGRVEALVLRGNFVKYIVWKVGKGMEDQEVENLVWSGRRQARQAQRHDVG